MRRILFSAFLLAPVAVIVVAACGDSSFSGSAESDSGADGSASDATTLSDSTATTDGSISTDGSSGDACPGTWCSCIGTTVFCDDFDKTDESVGGPWNLDGGFTGTDGGTLALTDAQSESKPTSLSATIDGDDLHNLNAALTESIGELTSPVALAFDIFIPQGGANCSDLIGVGQIGIGGLLLRKPSTSVTLNVNGNVLSLEMQGSTTTSSTAVASLPTGWSRIRIVARLLPVDGGASIFHADLFSDNAGSDDFVDASPIAIGATTSTTGSLYTTATVGVLGEDDPNSCTAYFDNVVVHRL